ncbi:MAG: hypothetical protein AAGM38_03390 [Pseudomonadota bacterium]
MRTLRTLFSWLATLILVFAGGTFMAGFFLVEPHIDPVETPARWTPNWALAAPPGVITATPPTFEAPIWRANPEELLAALDAAALSEPRTEIVTPPSGAPGAGDARSRTYLQRSAIIRYPDYVTALATPMESGADGPRASLVLYSRSVYGISDRGVNRARLDRWIAALDEALGRAR